LNLKAGVFLTNHDNPLGYCIGNQIEIEETIECLHGNIKEDLKELITKYGGYLLFRSNKAKSLDEGCQMILNKLQNGEALAKFKQMIIAQGVDETIAHELCDKRNYKGVWLKQSKYSSTIKSNKSGNCFVILIKTIKVILFLFII
jgi:thymidine phosphorylase